MELLAAFIGAVIGGGFALIGAFYQNKNAREVWARDLAEARVQAARERYSEFIHHFADWEVGLAERFDSFESFAPDELAAVHSKDSAFLDVLSVGYRTQALSVAIPSEEIKVQIKRLRDRMSEIAQTIGRVGAGQTTLTRDAFDQIMFEVRDQADRIMLQIENWDGVATKYKGGFPEAPEK
jgi:gas vesicle protein